MTLHTVPARCYLNMVIAICLSSGLAFELSGSTSAATRKSTDVEELEHAREAAHKGEYVECYNGICRVANHKHPQAQNVLGHMYEEGIGVEKNMQKAMQYYEKAALRGIPDAECRLGHLYYQGANGMKNPQKACYWLTRAAKHDMAEAQNTLGHMYLTGDGVKKDLQLASQWLHRAAINGVKEAAEAIVSLPPVKPFTKESQAGQTFEQSMGSIEHGWQGYGDIVQALRKAEAPLAQPQ